MFTRRKSFVEWAANGGAGMGTGAYVRRSVAKDHSLSCLANPNQLRFCAEELTLWRWGVALLCEPLYIGKIFARWAGKASLYEEPIDLGMLSLLRDLHFHWKIYQDQQQQTTIPHPKRWSGGDGFEAPQKCSEVWPPRGICLWISRQKTKRSNPVLSPFNFPNWGQPVGSRIQRNHKIKGCLSSGPPNPEDPLSETAGSSPLPTFSGSQVISLWQPLTELPEDLQQLSYQSHFSHLTCFSCISLRRDNTGKSTSLSALQSEHFE